MFDTEIKKGKSWSGRSPCSLCRMCILTYLVVCSSSWACFPVTNWAECERRTAIRERQTERKGGCCVRNPSPCTDAVVVAFTPQARGIPCSLSPAHINAATVAWQPTQGSHTEPDDKKHLWQRPGWGVRVSSGMFFGNIFHVYACVVRAHITAHPSMCAFVFMPSSCQNWTTVDGNVRVRGSFNGVLMLKVNVCVNRVRSASVMF